MRHWRIKLTVTAVVIAGFTFLLSCGGGGGGGGSGGVTPSIPYSGINTAAFITSENAVYLATGAYFGMGQEDQSGDIISLSVETPSDGSSDPPQINTLLLARTWERAVSTYLELHPPDRASPLARIDERMYGFCDGYADMDGSVNENNGDFSINITYQGFSDDCVLYMSGRTNESGNISPYDLDITHMTITYEALVFTNGRASVTQSGTWFMDYRQYPYREEINVVTRNDANGKTYWMRDYVVYSSTGWDGSSNYDEFDITGRYYDPDNGYVDISTEQALRIRYQEYYPYEGVLAIIGEGNTGARFVVNSNAAYHVTCDENGDGEYDDFDSGILHWPGENNLPIADAGTDQEAVVDCRVSLTGGTGSDPDDDALSYSWSFASFPQGSQSVLSGGNSPSPSFTSDVIGDYILELIVNDGMGNSPGDTIVISVIEGDFCNSEVIITYSNPEAVAIGDVNDDGKNDVVMTTSYTPNYNINNYSLFIFTQNSSGQLNSAVIYPSGDGVSVDIGDVNSDGKNDIVVTLDNGVGVFLQDSSGAIQNMVSYPSIHTTTTYSEGIRIGDFNDDGKLDVGLLIRGAIGTRLSVDVYLQKSDGTLDIPESYLLGDHGQDEMEVGDVNGDSLTDIVVTSGPGSSDSINDVSILLQNNAGEMNSPHYLTLASKPRGVAVNDVNGDSREDIVIAFTYPSSLLGILYQNQSGTLDSLVTYPGSYYGLDPVPLKIRDFNSDERQDIVTVTSSGYGPKVSIFLQNSDTTFSSYTTTSPSISGYPYTLHGLAVGDIDSDGKLEVVFSAPRGWSVEIGEPGLFIMSGYKW